MESMSQNKIWNLVDLLDGIKKLKLLSVNGFPRKKINIDGNIYILVAKCYKQIHDLDYVETYSLV